MNRETKRAMARQQKTADPQRLQQLRKQQLERQRAGRDGQPGAAVRGCVGWARSAARWWPSCGR